MRSDRTAPMPAGSLRPEMDAGEAPAPHGAGMLDTALARQIATAIRLVVLGLILAVDHAHWSPIKMAMIGVLTLYSFGGMLPDPLRARVLPSSAAPFVDAAMAASLVAIAGSAGQSTFLFAPVLYLPILEGALVFSLPVGMVLALGLTVSLPFLAGVPTVMQLLRPAFYAPAAGFAMPAVLLVGAVNRLNQALYGEAQNVDVLENDRTHLMEVQERTEFLAKHDSLTGLPNRGEFGAQFNSLIEQSRKQKQSSALMILDIDNFCEVNSSLGMDVGDEVLKALARRLSDSLRKTDFIGRFGSDEFAIAFSDIGASHDATTAATRLLEEAARPFMIDHHEVFVTATAGISIYPTDAHEAQVVFRNAESALRKGRQHGSNRVQLFTPELGARPAERMALEKDLRRALERDEFTLYYQPQVNLETRRLFGLEALIRWRHPSMGLVSPARFIPVAEESGLILPLTDWVLRAACRQNKEWQDAGFAPARVAVNLSARQFEHKNVVASVNDALRETGMDPRWLDLEVTESVALQDPEYTISALRALKELGVEISMDDFGTGYSSLAYLKKFPLDTIKIDQSFVREIGRDPGSIAIIATIIDLAGHLHRKVLAEGVETEDQLLALRKYNCHQIQGYLISKPVPAQELTRQFQTRPVGGVKKYSRYSEIDDTLFDTLSRYSYSMPPARLE